MKFFRFRLTRLLEVRDILQQRARAAWDAARRDLQEEQRKLDLFQKEQAAHLQEMKISSLRPHTAWSHATDSKYLSRVDRAASYQQRQVDRQTESTAVARRQFLDARQKRDVVIRLREKQYESWYMDHLRDQQKLLDDIRQRSSENSTDE